MVFEQANELERIIDALVKTPYHLADHVVGFLFRNKRLRGDG